VRLSVWLRAWGGGGGAVCGAVWDGVQASVRVSEWSNVRKGVRFRESRSCIQAPSWGGGQVAGTQEREVTPSWFQCCPGLLVGEIQAEILSPPNSSTSTIGIISPPARQSMGRGGPWLLYRQESATSPVCTTSQPGRIKQALPEAKY
jgi:hypothetical protein